MFKGIGNIAQMFKQAQEMSGKMTEVNETLKSKKIVGDAGGGMVTIEATGMSEVTKVTIDPKLVEGGETEMIEDLLVSAFNQISQKAKELHMESMRDMTSGINMPGLDDALQQLTGTPKEEE